ncbi:unnamed protein product [Moneuplotes crassus]|uniref:Uncharacterized protein n=1 Tax=Euplotes crassus TaxID=5936 RepID=A0AAD2D4I0_EUPCR|nr:unnamed protein product [Moneuplotes crassus]
MFNSKSPVSKLAKRILKLRSPRPRKLFRDPIVKDMKVSLKTKGRSRWSNNTKKSRRCIQRSLNKTLISPSRCTNRANIKSPLKLANKLILKKSRKTSDPTKTSSEQQIKVEQFKVQQKEHLFWRSFHSNIIEYTQNKVDDAKMARFKPLTSPLRLMDKLTQVRERNSRRVLSPGLQPRRGLLSPESTSEQQTFTTANDEALLNFEKNFRAGSSIT